MSGWVSTPTYDGPIECSGDAMAVALLAGNILEPIRVAARELGYAVGLHGSLARDIDLMAMPWTDTAVSGPVLAAAIAATITGITGPILLDVPPSIAQPKPHGRLCWSWWLVPWTYVDLSVMPPAPAQIDVVVPSHLL